MSCEQKIDHVYHVPNLTKIENALNQKGVRTIVLTYYF